MYAIAIDGPSSSGKSTVASLVAKKLNIPHLNTGDLYRALGLYALNNGLFNDLNSDGTVTIKRDDIKNIVKNTTISIDFKNNEQITYLNGVDVSSKLHTNEVSDYSSRVSQVLEIRAHVRDIQRNIATKQNVVMEGRDITSEVLPNAKYKFFITASLDIRAKRRYDEIINQGKNVNYSEIYEDLKIRDFRDENRPISPLVIVPDAVVIDTSTMTAREVADTILSYIKE